MCEGRGSERERCSEENQSGEGEGKLRAGDSGAEKTREETKKDSV